MDKIEFKRKLILSIVEKGLIAIVVALVGYWINVSLKSIDYKHQNNLADKEAELKLVEREFKQTLDSISAKKEIEKIAYSALLVKEIDSLKSSLKKSEIDKISAYQQFIIDQQNEFTRYQSILQQNHENELSRLKTIQQMKIDTAYLGLKSTLEKELAKIRTDLQLTNSVSLRSIQKVSEIWNLIYEFDFLSDELLDGVEAFDVKLHPATSDKSATIIGYKYQDMVKKKIEYNKLKKDLEYVLKTQRFWLTEKASRNIQNYMNCIDSIQLKTCIDKFKFIPPRKKNASLITRDEYQILLEKKIELQKNVFDEIKNAL